MAELPITYEYVKSMKRSQLTELATQLDVQFEEKFTKQKLIEAILSHVQLQEEDKEGAESTAESKPSSPAATVTKPPESKSKPIQWGKEAGAETWQFQLEMKRLELDAQREREERELQNKREERDLQMAREREARDHELQLAQLQYQHGGMPFARAAQAPHAETQFRVDTASKLLPKLTNEQEIETYLTTFEKIAIINNWPKEHWAAVLQTQLRGKGLKVFAEMSPADCRDFDKLNQALLTAYELCPEVYRTRFRNLTKQSETYSDYAFKLNNLFKRWLEGLKVYEDLNALRQAMLMEQFMNTIPSELKLWLTDQDPKTLTEMARLADQYVALRKSINLHSQQTTEVPQQDTNVMATYRSTDRTSKSPPARKNDHFTANKLNRQPYSATSKPRQLKPPITCFYCKKPNHTASECRTRIRKEKEEAAKSHTKTDPKVDLLIASNHTEVGDQSTEPVEPCQVLAIHPLFAPFCREAAIRSEDGMLIPVRTLRDTAALQSLVRKSAIPPSAYSHTGEVRLLKGISGSPIEVQLVELHLVTDFIDENILCGLIHELPEGVDFLLGNDIWFKVHPITEVAETAVVTRAQAAAQRAAESADDDPIGQSNSDSDTVQPISPDPTIHYGDLDVTAVKSSHDFKLLQQQDKSLTSLLGLVENPPFPVTRSYYYMNDDLLMHHAAPTKQRQEADQLVVPATLRNKLLFLAHDIPASGHLGITKTLSRLWPHFYWPHMSKEVTSYCRSCDMCQRLGKGQKPPPAPLIPLPLVTEPFFRVAMDIVGPLPTTKSGNRFILTVLDLSSHYPEAIPLPNHTATTVATALVGVFSRFGFPSEILSDQGSDLMSQIMQTFLNDFKITQVRTSAYHPQTNGSCERFHRTLKSMIRATSDKFPDAWDECLPWILFAYREIPVETSGFSPFEMLFGRNIRGPLSLIKSQWKPTSLRNAKPNVLEYMLNLREKLKTCQELAQTNARQARTKAKTWYDKKARERSYVPGQLVLVCLPVSGRPMDAKYCGPYRVLERLGPVDYLIATPDRKKTQRICHVNMLKAYVERDHQFVQPSSSTVAATTLVTEELSKVDDHNTYFGPSATDKDTGFVLDHLPPEQRRQLQQLLNKYKDIFNDKPGRTTVCSHTIDLQPGTKPIHMPPYRVNPQKAESIRKEIDLMLEMGVIEESTSPWASPVVLVPKPDGSIRFCTDFRRLNTVTISDAFPMPRVDDLIDKVGHAKYLTKLDLSRGYWQVPMDDESIPVSAFVTSFGHFQWKYMPFGLRNAPATFQRLVKNVLAGLEDFTGAYLDDIIIFSKTWSDHLRHLYLVFSRIQKAGLTIKRSKCVFATAEVEFLGHKVGLGKVEPRRKTVQVLLEFPRPSNQKQLRSYLGLAGYYRKFIPHFADLAASLNNLLRKGVKFTWTDQTEKAFLDLKSRLASRPILRPPNFDLPFSLAVDASNVAIGANLFQVIEGIEHPIAYYSKRLDVHQQRYSTVEKEALALVSAVRVFSVYFGTQPITVYTDHSPLQFVQRMSNFNQKLLRWALELQQYNLNIAHRAGKHNLIPDILSRPSSA